MLEGVLEGGVTEGVAGRVDCAVDVAQPVADGPESAGNAVGAEAVDQDHHVVRRPCGNESNQNGHDGACHFPFPGRIALLLPLCHNTLSHSTLCHLESESRRMKRCLSVFHLWQR